MLKSLSPEMLGNSKGSFKIPKGAPFKPSELYSTKRSMFLDSAIEDKGS